MAEDVVVLSCPSLMARASRERGGVVAAVANVPHVIDDATSPRQWPSSGDGMSSSL